MWLDSLSQMVDSAYVTVQKVSRDSALSPILLTCVFSPVAWLFGTILALYRPEIWLASLFFAVGCAPLLVTLAVGVYFAIKKPGMLRGGSHVIALKKLTMQKQGGPLVLLREMTPPVENRHLAAIAPAAEESSNVHVE